MVDVVEGVSQRPSQCLVPYLLAPVRTVPSWSRYVPQISSPRSLAQVGVPPCPEVAENDDGGPATTSPESRSVPTGVGHCVAVCPSVRLGLSGSVTIDFRRRGFLLRVNTPGVRSVKVDSKFFHRKWKPTKLKRSMSHSIHVSHHK